MIPNIFFMMARPNFPGMLEFNLHIDPSGQLKLHQCIDGLLGWLQDVEKSLVGANFKLFARLFVDVRRAQHRVALDLVGSGMDPKHARRCSWQLDYSWDASAKKYISLYMKALAKIGIAVL
jgi:hypothetical protein